MSSDTDKAKDALQVVAESAVDHLSKIAAIVTAAVRDIAKELGEWVNDVVSETKEPTQAPPEDTD